MKSIIIKLIFTLLLIIEFYPIESISQEVPEINSRVYNEYDAYTEGESFDEESFEEESFESEGGGTMEMNELKKIEFNIYETGNVSLKILNENGDLVETLVDGEMEPGVYTVYFKPYSDLPTGDYYYELDADDLTQHFRMFLAKY